MGLMNSNVTDEWQRELGRRPLFDDACHSWTELFLCHSIKISISLERLFQSFPFFHHCKGKFMAYLEMDLIFQDFSCS